MAVASDLPRVSLAVMPRADGCAAGGVAGWAAASAAGAAAGAVGVAGCAAAPPAASASASGVAGEVAAVVTEAGTGVAGFRAEPCTSICSAQLCGVLPAASATVTVTE